MHPSFFARRVYTKLVVVLLFHRGIIDGTLKTECFSPFPLFGCLFHLCAVIRAKSLANDVAVPRGIRWEHFVAILNSTKRFPWVRINSIFYYRDGLFPWNAALVSQCIISAHVFSVRDSYGAGELNLQ